MPEANAMQRMFVVLIVCPGFYSAVTTRRSDRQEMFEGCDDRKYL